jgi:hypothetical protein
MIKYDINAPVLNRFSDLSGRQKTENKSAIDKTEDDLFKVFTVNLESCQKEATPTSSMNLNDLNFNDLSLISVSNNS